MREHLSMSQYRMSEGEANPGRVVCIIRKRYGRCNLLICGGSQLLSEISFCFFGIDFSQNKIFAICIMIWKDSIRLQSTQLQSLYCQPNRSLQQICSSDHFVLIQLCRGNNSKLDYLFLLLGTISTYLHSQRLLIVIYNWQRANF